MKSFKKFFSYLCVLTCVLVGGDLTGNLLFFDDCKAITKEQSNKLVLEISKNFKHTLKVQPKVKSIVLSSILVVPTQLQVGTCSDRLIQRVIKYILDSNIIDPEDKDKLANIRHEEKPFDVLAQIDNSWKEFAEFMNKDLAKQWSYFEID